MRAHVSHIGRPAERANELERYPQNFAILTPRQARQLSTWNPPSHVEGAYLPNCMVQQPRNQVSEMLFNKFPDPSAFQCWKTSFKTEVCSCSSFPTDAMLWIKEVENGRISGHRHCWQSGTQNQKKGTGLLYCCNKCLMWKLRGLILWNAAAVWQTGKHRASKGESAWRTM